mmetsp:Transcript_101124/g.286355  ORF Transcript_101124/g.286355 Transcript_101124/m.286355 type:complete len:216 (+) Transcript_101124:799-1446(+)
MKSSELAKEAGLLFSCTPREPLLRKGTVAEESSWPGSSWWDLLFFSLLSTTDNPTTRTPMTDAAPSSSQTCVPVLRRGSPWRAGMCPTMAARTTREIIRPMQRQAASFSQSISTSSQSLSPPVRPCRTREHTEKNSRSTTNTATTVTVAIATLDAKGSYSRKFAKTSIAANPMAWPPMPATTVRAHVLGFTMLSDFRSPVEDLFRRHRSMASTPT